MLGKGNLVGGGGDLMGCAQCRGMFGGGSGPAAC